MSATPAELAFEKSVPEALREDVIQQIAEAAQDERYESETVSIVIRDRYDAINVQACGEVIVDGEPHWFVVEDGSSNGTTLRAWDDVGEEFREHVPTQWALQPIKRIIGEALEKGQGRFLVVKWDALLKHNENIAKIPGCYAYDKRVQPGSKVTAHWTQKAAEHLFEIVTKEEADETRATLLAAKDPQS